MISSKNNRNNIHHIIFSLKKHYVLQKIVARITSYQFWMSVLQVMAWSWVFWSQIANTSCIAGFAVEWKDVYIREWKGTCQNPFAGTLFSPVRASRPTEDGGSQAVTYTPSWALVFLPASVPSLSTTLDASWTVMLLAPGSFLADEQTRPGVVDWAIQAYISTLLWMSTLGVFVFAFPRPNYPAG